MPLIIIFGTLLYLLPSLVALSNKKNNAGAIFALNLLAGWTVIGWIGSFVWAVAKDGK